MSIERELRAGREKCWGELTADEKVERMRGEVKRLQHDLIDVRRQCLGLMIHEHSVAGHVVGRIDREMGPVPMGETLGGRLSRNQDPDKVYF